MGLRDELDRKHPGGLCSVKLLLDELDVSVADEILELLNDPTVSSGSLARLMKKKGWRHVGGHAFARHRRKDCKCL